MRKPFRVSAGMRSDDTLTAAKAYIKAGRKVVLLHGIKKDGTCSCGDPHCANPGKHPIAQFFPKGLRSATDDISVIREALRSHKNANVAITLEGLTVVDIDGPKGRAAVKKLKLNKTVRVKTGRGTHLCHHGELSSGSIKADQVDVLTGSKRMAIVPPSTHKNGKRYAFSKLSARETASVPEKLATLKSASNGTRSRGQKERSSTNLIKLGERNERLFRAACGLRRQLTDERVVLKMIQVLNAESCKPPLSHGELRKLVSSGARYFESSDDLFGPPAETSPLSVDWLWPERIPKHGVTVLAGDPGRGKSLLIAKIVATVTSGLAWPLCKKKSQAGPVLLLSAEDNWQRVTLPRLLQAGADIDNLDVMHKFRALTPERLDALADYMERERPSLVVVDTFSAYMGGARDMHRQNEVGEFLALLTEMAESTGAAVLGLAHLNKQTNEHPLFRIVGSIGFMASVRSALFLGADPSDPSRLALAHGKANASAKAKTMIFDMHLGNPDAPELRPVCLSDATAIEVCRVERNAVGRPSRQREAAIEFVLEYLSDEPIAWQDVVRAAEARAVASEGTLDTVRTDLAKRGKIVQDGKGRKAKWRLGDNKD